MVVPIREEIANALKEGEHVLFTKAALDITCLTNSMDATNRLRQFLSWVRDNYADDFDSEAWRLLNNMIAEENPQLTTSAIELFKNRFFPVFDGILFRGRAEKRRKVKNGAHAPMNGSFLKAQKPLIKVGVSLAVYSGAVRNFFLRSPNKDV